MKLKNPDIRHLNEMKQVLYDKEWTQKAPNLELYYMYRNLKQKGHLRYDITIIPFRMLGQEFVKTKGHEHPGNFSELYEVLKGRAIFLLQKEENGLIKDVYAIKAKPKDKVFIPSGYGHVTINPGPEKLKIANWVSDQFESDYSLFLEKGGACYFLLKEAGWLKNNNYSAIPPLRFEKPNQNIPKDLSLLATTTAPSLGDSSS